MIMILAIIYITKITFVKSLAPPEKIHPLFYSPHPLKFQKVQLPPLFANIGNFTALPPTESGKKGGRTLCSTFRWDKGRNNGDTQTCGDFQGCFNWSWEYQIKDSS